LVVVVRTRIRGSSLFAGAFRGSSREFPIGRAREISGLADHPIVERFAGAHVAFRRVVTLVAAVAHRTQLAGRSTVRGSCGALRARLGNGADAVLEQHPPDWTDARFPA